MGRWTVVLPTRSCEMGGEGLVSMEDSESLRGGDVPRSGLRGVSVIVTDISNDNDCTNNIDSSSVSANVMDRG